MLLLGDVNRLNTKVSSSGGALATTDWEQLTCQLRTASTKHTLHCAMFFKLAAKA